MKEVRAEYNPYPTDLTDALRKEIEPLYSGIRNRKWCKRELANAVLYIVKTDCQWHQLPHDFPPYQRGGTAFSAVEQSRDYGRSSSLIWLRKLVKMQRKSAEPHYALIDSQSVKLLRTMKSAASTEEQHDASVMPS